MALELELSKGALNDTDGTLIISDSTGNYDASDNTTGYGAPNPDREDLALFLRAYNNRYEGESDVTGTLLTDTPDDSDPTATAQWTLTLAEDGWIKCTVYGLRLYSTSTSFELNELTYDTGTSTIRKILTKTGSGPYTYTYEAVEEDALEDDDNVVAYSTVFNTYAIPDLCSCHLQSVESYFDEDDISEKQLKWNLSQKIRMYLVSIRNSFLIGSPAEAQKKVERAEAICACFTDNCGC